MYYAYFIRLLRRERHAINRIRPALECFKVLDQASDTEIPVEINRRGRMLRIVSVGKKSKLANVKKRPIIKGDPEDLVHMVWLS